MTRVLITFGILTVVGCALSDPICNKEMSIKSLFDCCSYPDLFTPAIQEKCKSYLEKDDAKKDDMEAMPRMNTCYMECALNETGIMIKPDEVDDAKVKTYLGGLLNEDNKDIQPVIEAAITKCIAKGKEMKEKMQKKHEGGPQKDGADKEGQKKMCKPCSMHFVKCVKSEIALNCPANKWAKENESCNNVRDYFKTCNPATHHHDH